MQQEQLKNVPSPLAEMSARIENPTEAEAAAWVNLTRQERTILARASMQTEQIISRGWFDLLASQRMAIRNIIQIINRAGSAFEVSNV